MDGILSLCVPRSIPAGPSRISPAPPFPFLPRTIDHSGPGPLRGVGICPGLFTQFAPLSFQSLPHCPDCKPFVLTFIQHAGGVYPLSSSPRVPYTSRAVFESLFSTPCALFQVTYALSPLLPLQETGGEGGQRRRNRTKKLSRGASLRGQGTPADPARLRSERARSSSKPLFRSAGNIWRFGLRIRRRSNLSGGRHRKRGTSLPEKSTYASSLRRNSYRSMAATTPIAPSSRGSVR